MDTGEGMCYGECCEVCKPGNSQTCTPGANNTYMLIKKTKTLNIFGDQETFTY